MNHRGEDFLRVALRASGAVGLIADVQDARGAVGTPVPTSPEGIQDYQMLAAGRPTVEGARVRTKQDRLEKDADMGATSAMANGEATGRRTEATP